MSDWRRNIRVYLIDSVLQWFYVPIGVWVIIWRNYLSFTQIGIVTGIGLLVSILLELPTGALADMIGRKKPSSSAGCWASPGSSPMRQRPTSPVS
ncbi:hypothetical protein A2Z33_02180 [Candidatus Gottesmanbacteria bacterium RBG_16_52_11]|uniref:Major facilitator superfamily (MFS) profile domain-containing protein n=1 Tax=Candidatus Gottesmanbacteria bacterium RBG_16_52_11 TaxID=1798374 RepID=A0A1F5YR42_9BACT|nr:MAG: hypothetical protein A2Z33_02180 [Candidatus Gottesmanbacteria bacterium RBG_16_52_11]